MWQPQISPIWFGHTKTIKQKKVFCTSAVFFHREVSELVRIYICNVFCIVAVWNELCWIILPFANLLLWVISQQHVLTYWFIPFGKVEPKLWWMGKPILTSPHKYSLRLTTIEYRKRTFKFKYDALIRIRNSSTAQSRRTQLTTAVSLMTWVIHLPLSPLLDFAVSIIHSFSQKVVAFERAQDII